MLLFLTVTSLALQASVADTSPFRALPLPAPNRVRGASGVPGPDYWQQRADYVIRATLDTAGSLLRGTERIRYENHSPDTLRFVWVQIEQNIFAQNSATYALNQPPLHFAGGAVFDFTGKGFVGGITIERFAAAGSELRRTEYGTMMRRSSRSEEHTSELQSHSDLVCRLLLEKKKIKKTKKNNNEKKNT